MHRKIFAVEEGLIRRRLNTNLVIFFGAYKTDDLILRVGVIFPDSIGESDTKACRYQPSPEYDIFAFLTTVALRRFRIVLSKLLDSSITSNRRLGIPYAMFILESFGE